MQEWEHGSTNLDFRLINFVTSTSPFRVCYILNYTSVPLQGWNCTGMDCNHLALEGIQCLAVVNTVMTFLIAKQQETTVAIKH
jgi:hypothetical protein